MKIICEGAKFDYVTASELLNIEYAGDRVGLTENAFRELGSGRDTRFSYFEGLRNKELSTPYWLVWQEEVNLSLLDQKVCNQTFTEADFANAFRTFPSRTQCIYCNHWYDTLVIDDGDPYFGAPGLLNKKVSKVRSLKCPNCGNSLRRLVVKFINGILPGPRNVNFIDIN